MSLVTLRHERWLLDDGSTTLDVFVEPDVDWDSRFKAIDTDTGEVLYVNGWMILDKERAEYCPACGKIGCGSDCPEMAEAMKPDYVTHICSITGHPHYTAVSARAIAAEQVR